MPKYPLSHEQNAKLFKLLEMYPDFFNELFGLSLVTNMRKLNPQADTADENRLNEFIRALEFKFSDSGEDPYLSGIIVVDVIKAEINNYPEDARALHEAAVFSFKGNIRNKNVRLRTDLLHDNEYSPDILTGAARAGERRENFFEATELGRIIAKHLLEKNSQEAIIKLAEAFKSEYPQIEQNKANSRTINSKLRLNLVQQEITPLSPEEPVRSALLKAIFSANKRGKLSENEKIYKKWLLPLINSSNFKDQKELNASLPIFAATVYRLWMRKFLDSKPSLQQIYEELHLLVQNKVTYMDRFQSYKATIADKFGSQMVQDLLDYAANNFDSKKVDSALIQAIASWSPQERAYITQKSSLKYIANLDQWEFLPAPSYSGNIGVKCTIKDKDGTAMTLTRKHVIIEDVEYDAKADEITHPKVTSFLTFADSNDNSLVHHMIAAKDILREHTSIATDQNPTSTLIDPNAASLFDYIANPEEFNKEGKAKFIVGVYDPDTTSTKIRAKFALSFPGITSIPQNMTLSKDDNVLKFNINKLLGISSEDYTIAFTPGISPEIGELIEADVNGNITLKINPPAPGFKERAGRTNINTHNFDANMDLRFKIIPKSKDTATQAKDKTLTTRIALNVPLSELQDPKVTTLKPRFKFIIDRKLLQNKLYQNRDFKIALELIHPKSAFSSKVTEAAIGLDEYVSKTINEIDKNNANKPIMELISLCNRYISEREDKPKILDTDDIDGMIEDLKTDALNVAIVPHLITKIETMLKQYSGDDKSTLERDLIDLKTRSEVHLDSSKHRTFSI